MSIRLATRIGMSGLALLCCLTFVGTVQADMPDVVFEVTADAGPISVTIPILAEWGTYDPATQTWTFNLADSMDFEYEDGTILGTLSQFDVMIREDPEVNLNFAVQSGSSATHFHIASELFTFAPITNPIGTASAAMTVSDQDGTGAQLLGAGPNGGAYLAQYNGWAGDPINGPSGTTFHEGIVEIDADPFLSADDSTNQDWTAIGETVESMSALISFDLTANDLASGTSHFEIVPEPASIGLLALGAFALLRRR